MWMTKKTEKKDGRTTVKTRSWYVGHILLKLQTEYSIFIVCE